MATLLVGRMRIIWEIDLENNVVECGDRLKQALDATVNKLLAFPSDATVVHDHDHDHVHHKWGSLWRFEVNLQSLVLHNMNKK